MTILGTGDKTAEANMAVSNRRPASYMWAKVAYLAPWRRRFANHLVRLSSGGIARIRQNSVGPHLSFFISVFFGVNDACVGRS